MFRINNQLFIIIIFFPFLFTGCPNGPVPHENNYKEESYYLKNNKIYNSEGVEQLILIDEYYHNDKNKEKVNEK